MDQKTFDILESTCRALSGELQEAIYQGKKYISSFLSQDILIFDVRQPSDKRDWDLLDQREQVESLFFSLPDYILRDRIYVIPEYLNIHLRGLTLSEDEFLRTLSEMKKSHAIRHVIKVYEEHDHRNTYNLGDGPTRWAHRECAMTYVNPGERVLFNVPIKLDDALKSYMFVKLARDEIIFEPYLAITTETCNLEKHLEASLDVIRFFSHLNAV